MKARPKILGTCLGEETSVEITPNLTNIPQKWVNPRGVGTIGLYRRISPSIFIALVCAIVLYRTRLRHRSLSHSFAPPFFIALVCAIVLYRTRLRHRSLSHWFARPFFIALVCAIVVYRTRWRDRSLSHSVARSFFIAFVCAIVLCRSIVLFRKSVGPRLCQNLKK